MQVDLFREKLGHASIKRYFADYDGDETDYNTARDYFKNRFVTLNRSRKKEVCESFCQRSALIR